MNATRTPDERFQLGIIEREFPYEPKYCTVGDLRMAYIDEGSGPIVIFLHGEPSWSFLYRHMIKLCVAGASPVPTAVQMMVVAPMVTGRCVTVLPSGLCQRQRVLLVGVGLKPHTV